VIIANVAFSAGLDLWSLPRQGIDHVTLSDVRRWRDEGITPRLVGFIDREADPPKAGVELRLFPNDHPFALTRGGMKGIRVETEEMGDLTVLGGASNPLGAAAAALKDFEHLLAQRA
jgi:homoserine dehydrogenase